MSSHRMGTHHMLELTLNEILHVINPLKEDVETRMRIIDELRKIVSEIESLRGATVEPFGSFLSQLFTRWGDLDISIELSNGSHIFMAAKKQKLTMLADIHKVLRRIGSFRRVLLVSHARVPILKFESIYQNISCDISVNNLSGQMKSKFLLWISLIDRRFRDMVLLVKEWAKGNGINCSKMGTLNSYSLSLLVVFHFQTCEPAILPPLRDLYPGNMADELIGVRADVERHIEEVSVNNIAKFRKERRVNQSSLSELFTSFLLKFSDIGMRAAYQGICTYSGRWEDIHTNTRWLPRTYAIFIEDPFEQPQNSARAVTAVQLTRIAAVFTNTYRRLIVPNQSRNTLIPHLVRHEISHFFPGAAFNSTCFNGEGWYNARRVNHSASQFQYQLQKIRQVGQPSSSTLQKAKQGSQRQAQAPKPQFSNNNFGSQRKKAAGQEAAQNSQGQVRPVSHQQVKPPWPHTLLPDKANHLASQQSVKTSQGQLQRVWKPKESDK